MAVIRITKDLRKTIVIRALDDAFRKRKDDLYKAEYALALRARTHVFGEDLVKQVAALPDGWTGISLHMDFNCGGPKIRLSFERTQRVPQNWHNTTQPIRDEALRMEILKHADDRSTLKKEEDTACTALDNLIIKCSTIKILGEQWPEGREYYKDLQPATLPPMVKTEEVNRMLGLPK